MTDRPTEGQTLLWSGHNALGKLGMPAIPFAWSKINILVGFHESVTDGPTNESTDRRTDRPSYREHQKSGRVKKQKKEKIHLWES